MWVWKINVYLYSKQSSNKIHSGMIQMVSPSLELALDLDPSQFSAQSVANTEFVLTIETEVRLLSCK